MTLFPHEGISKKISMVYVLYVGMIYEPLSQKFPPYSIFS